MGTRRAAWKPFSFSYTERVSLRTCYDFRDTLFVRLQEICGQDIGFITAFGYFFISEVVRERRRKWRDDKWKEEFLGIFVCQV